MYGKINRFDLKEVTKHLLKRNQFLTIVYQTIYIMIMNLFSS